MTFVPSVCNRLDRNTSGLVTFAKTYKGAKTLADHFRERTEKNYSIELMPARCGCCWKDAVEYIWTVDHDIVPLNRLYYLHCFEVLRATMCKERRWFVHYVEIVWEEYLFYPMSKSKLYEELKDATYTAKGKIKCAVKDIKR